MSNIPEEAKNPTSAFLRILQRPEGKSSQPSLQRLKELRKLLAELQLETTRLGKKEGWDRDKRLEFAFLQAKVRRLSQADVFVDLEDIQYLAGIESSVEDLLHGGMESGGLEADPLEEMLDGAKELSSSMKDVMRDYDEILDILGGTKEADWTLGQLEQELEANKTKWETFTNRLEEARDTLTNAFKGSPDGPEPTLLAIDQILNPDNRITDGNPEEVLGLTTKEGELWEKSNRLFEQCQERLWQLVSIHNEDRGRLEKANSLAEEGNYQQARELLNQVTGKFSDLPYGDVQKEILRWQHLALQPFRELAALLPSAQEPDHTRETLLALDSQFHSMAKGSLQRRLRRILNPFGLFVLGKRLEGTTKTFITKCSQALEEVKGHPPSDYREVLEARWKKTLGHANFFLGETGKQTTGFFFKKNMVAGLLVVCGFFGFKLLEFNYKLPKTGIQFSRSGLPVLSVLLEDSQGNALRRWTGWDTANVRLPGIPPDTYALLVDFADSFPVEIKAGVNLGQFSELSNDLAQSYGTSQGRSLEFTVPAGSQIILKDKQSGLERTYGVVPETLPTGITSFTGLDWDPGSEILAVSELGGRIQVLSTHEENKVLGTIFVQGQTFQGTKLGRQQGKLFVAGIALGGDTYVWEAGAGKLVGEFNHGGQEVVAMAFSQKGNAFFTLDSSYTLRSWKLDSGKQESGYGLPTNGRSQTDWSVAQLHPAWKLDLPASLKISLGNKPKLAEILPNSQSRPLMVGVMNVNGRLQIWSGETPENLKLVLQTPEGLDAFAIHPSGKWAVIADPVSGLLKTPLTTGDSHPIWTPRLENGTSRITKVKFDPTGDALAAVNSTGNLFQVTLHEPISVNRLQPKISAQAAMVSSPMMEKIALLSLGGQIQVWKTMMKRRIFLSPGSYSIQVKSPSGMLLYEASPNIESGGVHKIMVPPKKDTGNQALFEPGLPPIQMNTIGNSPTSGLSPTGGSQ